MRKLLQTLGTMLILLLAASALADSWAPPSIRQYASADGTWRLTIYPRPLTTQLNYFKDKVDGKRNAGGVPGESQKSPVGHMEHRVGGRWTTAWKEPLVNDVAPVEVVLSNRGEAITLDNWHSMGWGDDAVVIYATSGTRVRQFGLADFLPKYYVDALPRTVSSIHWRGDARVDEAKRQLIIPIVVPTLDASAVLTGKARYLDARFHLSDGSLVPMDGKAWGSAVAAAIEVNARHKQERAEQRARFISPLAPPQDGNVTSWHQYLLEAFYRVDPDWQNGYPDTDVVPLPSDPHFKLLAGYVGDSLTDRGHVEGVVMIASPSQDVLVATLIKQAKRVKPGFLAKARVYVAANDDHMPAIRTALSPTGAKVVQLDINATIPQRRERLDRLRRDEESDE
jgi:hypothetical protein